MTAYLITVSAIFGLLLGSFLNALAYRLPRKESLMTRSHCTQCFKQIRAWENIPVLSWLALRGKCSQCKKPISIQYPLIELFVSATFAGLMWQATRIAPPLDSIAATLIVALLFFSFAFVGVLIALIDLKTMTIPTKAVWIGLAVALVALLGYLLVTGDWQRVVQALIASVIVSAVYFTIWFFKSSALGYGDVRLSVFIGLVLGFVSPGVVVLGFFLPWVLAMIWLFPSLVKRKLSRKDKVPLGPWLVLGTLIAIVFGDIVVKLYLQLGSYS